MPHSPFGSRLNNGSVTIEEDDKSPNSQAWKWNDSQVSVVYRCAFESLQDVIKELLGYPERGLDTSFTPSKPCLVRYLPHRCPAYPWLYCVGISSIKFMGTPSSTTCPIPNVGCYTSWTLPGDGKPCEVTVIYSPPQFPILDEDDLKRGKAEATAGLSCESKRFTTWLAESSLEMLDSGTGCLRYAVGPPAASPIPGANIIPFPWKVRLPKTVHKITWHQLPENVVYPNGGRRLSSNITNAYGKVNSGYFEGFPPGVLLCLPAKAVPPAAPVSPQVLGLVGPSWIPRTWNLEMNLVEFDPPYYDGADAIRPHIPPDPLIPPGEPNPPYYRGHNLIPTRDLSDHRWLYATRNGLTTGHPAYEEYSFHQIFTPF